MSEPSTPVDKSVDTPGTRLRPWVYDDLLKLRNAIEEAPPTWGPEPISQYLPPLHRDSPPCQIGPYTEPAGTDVEVLVADMISLASGGQMLGLELLARQIVSLVRYYQP